MGASVFKRNPRSYLRIVAEFFYPRGGWYRAAGYVIHRVRRLPDPPHRISRGIAAGVFVCFTPFFGMHFLFAAIVAWVIRGNILASLLATFFGNPLTFPLIAELSISLGARFMGLPMDIHLPQIVEAFGAALGDLWFNFKAAFSDARADWRDLHHFFHRVFLPYLVGGLLPGVGSGMMAYGLSRPVIHAYQRRRIKKLRARYEKRMAARTEADVAE
ncbi:DUF2062 domain-containing protein [Aliiroseovarius sp.]|uniref:DUF2062 domain-containing protein n=1 Tax=Aliiroseovarius sp. TaxID=1872442 RepID=UPI003BA9905C